MKSYINKFAVMLLITVLALFTGCGALDGAGNNSAFQTSKSNDIIDSNNAEPSIDDDYEEGGGGGGGGDSPKESSISEPISNTERMNVEEMLIEVYYQDKEGFLVPVTR